MRVNCRLESRHENGTEVHVVTVLLTRADLALLVDAKRDAGGLSRLLAAPVRAVLEDELGITTAQRKRGRR